MSWSYEWSNDVGPDDEYYIEFYEINDETGKVIGRMEEESDARLVSSAQDMLDALKSVVHWHGTRDSEDSLLPEDQQTNGIELAMAAIAKATGENK